MSRAVSVVMAVYNGAPHLKAQLTTMLADLAPIDEVIVVDDASHDDSLRIVESLAEPRIRVIRHARNLGVRRTFEDGLSAASHEVIFLCDQDDLWQRGKRDALTACFERDPGCMVALSDAAIIDAAANLRGESFMATRGGFRGGLLANLLRNRFLGCTMALRRSLLEVVLPIPAAAPMHDMWIGSLATMVGRVAYVPAPLIQYRRHEGNVTPTTEGSTASFLQMVRWRVLLLGSVVLRLLRWRVTRRHPA